jgi:hypothetical protein
MAETKTSEVLAAEAGQQKDLGLYSQGKLKLNFNEESGAWEQSYEPVKPSKMFIPPQPTEVKLPTDVTVPEIPTTEEPIIEVTQPAEPLISQPDRGESFAERRRREDMERFGPGQDPMTFSKTMSSIFTPGTEQNLYYSTRGILNQEGDKLTVNFDQIDEAGGYGLPSILGGVLKVAEKDIIENTVNKLRFAGIIEGNEVDKTTGTYEFTIDRNKMDAYTQNVSNLANKLTGGYRDESGNYRQRNDYLIEELGKLGKEEATKFISDMAILSDNENIKNVINQAIDFGTKGAAAALITFQQGGEELDLDATGLFGFKKYNDAFKEAYTTTLNQLRAAEEQTSSEQPSGIDTKGIVSAKKEEQRQQSESMKNTFNALIEEAKQARDPKVKTALLNRASAYSGAGDIAEPTEDGKQFPSSYGGVYQGDTKKTSTSSGNKSSQGLTSKQKEAIASSGSSSNKASSSYTKRAAPVKSTLTGGIKSGTKGYTRGK